MCLATSRHTSILNDSTGCVLNGTDTDGLLTLAQSGDQSAQNVLLVRHKDRLRRMVMALMDPRLSARIDPSDVLQDAFATATRQFPKYLENPSIDFYPWLRQIVKEELINMHRHHVRAQRRSVVRERFSYRVVDETSVMQLAEKLISREQSPSSIAYQREQLDAVKKGMERMSEAERELLLMRFIERLTIREISAVQGIAKSTARLRVLRAVQRLSSFVNKD